jgi:hypothetical protein
MELYNKKESAVYETQRGQQFVKTAVLITLRTKPGVG